MNVNFLYPLLPCVGRGSLVALHVEDLNFGRTVLNSQRHQSPVPAGPQPVGTAVFPFFPAALFRSVFSKRLKGLPGFSP